MTLVVYPFLCKDARTGRWVKARYKAERTEIAARYAEWEIIGPWRGTAAEDGLLQSGEAGGRVAGRWRTMRVHPARPDAPARTAP